MSVKVLFVCMGNICRSPTAHGVFEEKVKQAGLSDRIDVDSAGTHAYHVGEQPDSRSQETALRRGYDLSYQRARKAIAEDFNEFDYILAMDEDNYHNLLSIKREDARGQLSIFLDFSQSFKGQSVPDPYYGGPLGFERVFDMVEEASEGLLQHIRQQNSL